MRFAASLIFADESIMQGDFPPSSRVTGVKYSAAWRRISFPTV